MEGMWTHPSKEIIMTSPLPPSMSQELMKLKTSILKKTPSQSVEIIKKYAQDGNIHAANIYGDMLMEGVWDTKRMHVDLVRGNLLYEQNEEGIDPYLLIERDVLKALDFYKFVASSEGESEVRRLARSKLAYCMIKGYAGYTVTDEKDLESIYREAIVNTAPSVKYFLWRNARSASIFKDDSEFGASFIPLPNPRPLVSNPKTEVFKHMALRMRDRNLFQICIASLLSFLVFFYSSRANSTLVMGCILTAFILPLLLLTILDHYSSFHDAVPICSCSRIVTAYKLAVKDLPADCLQDGDPFVKTPAYIRYSHMAKGIYFWFYAIVSGLRIVVVLVGLLHQLNWLTRLDIYNPKAIIFITLPLNFFILSFCFVLMDKTINFSHIGETHDDTDSSNLFYFIIGLVLSVISDDKDCEIEYKRITIKKGLDKFIDQLC